MSGTLVGISRLWKCCGSAIIMLIMFSLEFHHPESWILVVILRTGVSEMGNRTIQPVKASWVFPDDLEWFVSVPNTQSNA